MKNTGIILTAVGSVLTIIGVVTLLNSSPYGESTGNLGLGAIESLIGTGILSAGIPSWKVGSYCEKKFTRKLQGFSFKFNLHPQYSGLSLAYGF